MERAALFIDGSNVHATSVSTGFFIDYDKLLRYFRERYTIVRPYFYTAISSTSNVLKLVEHLTHNEYEVRSKPAKEITDSSTGLVKVKGNVDIEMCVDMIKFAPHLDRVILFSGDGDFVPVVQFLKDMQKKVTVVSSRKTRPAPMIAEELRKAADQFIEITDLPVRHIKPRSASLVVDAVREETATRKVSLLATRRIVTGRN